MARSQPPEGDAKPGNSLPGDRPPGDSSPGDRPPTRKSLAALKSLGQHFLVDRGIADRIVDAAEVVPGDTVLEVGPGRGILTRALLDRGARVVAVEIDRGLIGHLKTMFAAELDGPGNRDGGLTLHHEDALKFDLAPVPRPFKVVANLPYQITTPLIFRLLESTPPPTRVVVMVQREVAQRMAAVSGDASYGVLSLGVGLHAAVNLCFTLPPGAFRPRPKVDSSVVRLTPHDPPLMDPEARLAVLGVVRAALGARRKTLKNALGRLGLPAEVIAAGITGAGLDPGTRGERLNQADFIRLTHALYPDA